MHALKMKTFRGTGAVSNGKRKTPQASYFRLAKEKPEKARTVHLKQILENKELTQIRALEGREIDGRNHLLDAQEIFVFTCYAKIASFLHKTFLSRDSLFDYNLLGGWEFSKAVKILNRLAGKEEEDKSQRLNYEEQLILADLYEKAPKARRGEVFNARDIKRELDVQKRLAEIMLKSQGGIYLKLAVALHRQRSPQGISIRDLFQEARLAVIKWAMPYFDLAMGNKFSTYATYWANQAMRRHISDKSRTVDLPVYVSEAFDKIKSYISAYYLKEGRKPDAEEIISGLNLSETTVNYFLQHGEDSSLDGHYYDGDPSSTPIYDRLPDEAAENPEKKILSKLMKGDVAKILSNLKPVHRAVLLRRFGVQGFQEMTLEEIGQEFHLTRERIRQIQVQAMKEARKVARKLGMEF